MLYLLWWFETKALLRPPSLALVYTTGQGQYALLTHEFHHHQTMTNPYLYSIWSPSDATSARQEVDTNSANPYAGCSGSDSTCKPG